MQSNIALPRHLECLEYSKPVTKEITLGSSCLTDDCPIAILRQSTCKSAGGMILGGEYTDVGEFPHMAGELMVIKSLNLCNYDYFKRLVGKAQQGALRSNAVGL